MNYLNEPIAGLESLAPVIVPLLLMVLIFLFIVLILVIALRHAGGSSEKHFLYQRRDSFLTRNELMFYASLLPLAAERKMIIFVKVRISDLIEPQKDCTNKQASINRINPRCIDFLLCDQSTLAPQLGIEMVDASRKNTDRFDRESSVDKAFQSAGLPVLFLRSSDNLEQRIASALDSDNTTKQSEQPA